MSSATGETILTEETRVSVTPEKRIPNKNINIKSLSLSPFIAGNKIQLKEGNYHNPETTDTSQSEKYYISHISRDYFIEKVKRHKNTNDDDEYKEDTSKHQDSNESIDNPETSDTLCDDRIIKTIK